MSKYNLIILLVFTLVSCTNNDKDKDLVLYKNGCDGGSPDGCAKLGRYEYDKGSKTKAYEYFKKACDGNETESCSMLGYSEEDKGNTSLAMEYFRKSCDLDYMMICTHLGNMETNMELKIKLFRKACKGKSVSECKDKESFCKIQIDACSYLAKNSTDKNDIETAKKNLNKSCGDGNHQSCDYLKEIN